MNKILVQLDPDSQPSLFDSVVAIDCDVDHVLQYDNVQPADVREIVHGAIFTRSAKKLCNTAIFIGGGDVARGEALLDQVRDAFFGPLRVSVLLDANGCNTTAAAAVLAAAQHLKLSETTSTVLAGTGPVGQRAARLLAGAGSQVRVCSRKLDRAESSAAKIRLALEGRDQTGKLTPCQVRTEHDALHALEGAQLVLAAGAPGIELLSSNARSQANAVRVAIDLNAVPPLGIEGVEVTDRGEHRESVICYGAIGVGSVKMDIHRAAIRKLFTANDLVLDVDEVFAIGQAL